MLDWALNRPGAPAGGPVMIRYPKAVCPPGIPAFTAPLEAGRGVWISRDSGLRGKAPVCIAFTGGLYPQALNAAERR